MEIGTLHVVATPEPVAELERLGDEIAALAVHLDAATARLLELIREFDTRGGWNHGFRSCAQSQLACRHGDGRAREHVRVARALGSLPRIADALARGELSYSKVRALTRVATLETEEPVLPRRRQGRHRVPRGAHRPRLAARRSAWLRRARIRAVSKARGLHVYEDEDGTVMIHGRLTTEQGVRAHEGRLAAARETCHQRTAKHASDLARRRSRGDALGRTSASGRTHSARRGCPPPLPRPRRPGRALPGRRPRRCRRCWLTSRPRAIRPRWGHARSRGNVPSGCACDATRVIMRHEPDGQITEVGARTRTIPPAIRRALHHRDRGCRFPGCGLPFGQGHHIRHWAHGGPTTLSNLALLCRRHHRAVTRRATAWNARPTGRCGSSDQTGDCSQTSTPARRAPQPRRGYPNNERGERTPLARSNGMPGLEG